MMLDVAQRITLRATQAGPIAHAALRAGARGTVHSVFERSAYVVLDGALICVGSTGLGAGPLNLLCQSWPDKLSLNDVLRVDQPVFVHTEMVQVGATLVISTVAVTRWSVPIAQHWNAGTLNRGLSALAAAWNGILPAEGLARLLTDDGQQTSPVIAAARRPAESVAGLTQSPAPQVPPVAAEELVPLLGLGPGLTPSGDDFLGGAFVALTLIGRESMRDALWRTVQPAARASTTEISCAHLSAAAQGLGSAALHDLLNAVLAGDTALIPPRLRAVAAIGHTSGWDALAGAVTVLRAVAGGNARR